MNLFSLCLHVIGREADKIVTQDVEHLPVNVKTALFTTLTKRGVNSTLLKWLLNPAVRIVDLGECFVTDELLNGIQVCRNLKMMDLSLRRRQQRSITSGVLGSVFSYLPHLQVLAVPYCKEVNDDVLTSVCEHCQGLIELHIPGSSITDTGMKMIGASLKLLAVINISKTKVISDRGMEYLVLSPLSLTLTEINIDNCPNMTLETYRLVVDNCQNVKIFSYGVLECSESCLTLQTNPKQLFWHFKL